MKVKVINQSENDLPAYATLGSAGMDLRASFNDLKAFKFYEGARLADDEDCFRVVMPPGSRALIPTNLFVNVPEGYELQIRPRSGLSLKNGITCANAVGTVDSDYTGNIGIILLNTSDDVFYVESGDRIAQAVLNKVEHIEWEEVDKLDETERGSGGYGHTGKQ